VGVASVKVITPSVGGLAKHTAMQLLAAVVQGAPSQSLQSVRGASTAKRSVANAGEDAPAHATMGAAVARTARQARSEDRKCRRVIVDY
jgi:hypothetical protein